MGGVSTSGGVTEAAIRSLAERPATTRARLFGVWIRARREWVRQVAGMSMDAPTGFRRINAQLNVTTRLLARTSPNLNADKVHYVS